MTSNLRRILAICLCMILLVAHGALAQEAGDQGGDTALSDGGSDDFTTDVDDFDDGGDVNPPGDDLDAPTQPPAESPTPTPTAKSSTAGVASDITTKCDAKVSGGDAKNLADRKPNTTWTTQKSNAWIEIKFPSSVTGLYIQWGKEGASFTLSELDSKRNVTSTRTDADTFPCLKTYFEIDPEARGIRLDFPNTGASIAELHVLTGGLPGSDKQMWEPPLNNADLLVIASNYGDEFLYFGGILPYYMDRNISTQLVFVSDYGREIKEQALSALWAAGVRNYPIFLSKEYVKGKTVNDIITRWGEEATVTQLVSLLRKTRPSVVVSNSTSGEKNDGYRAVTAQFVQQAVTRAAQSEYDPVSLSEYDTWQVQKLYLHLADQNQITMDWNAVGSQSTTSSMSVARSAYDKYTTLKKVDAFTEGGAYDNSKFGLVFTSGAADTVGGDFFENVSVDPGEFSAEMDPDDTDVNWSEPEDPDLPEENINDAFDAILTPAETEEPTPSPSPTPTPSGFGFREDLSALKGVLIALLVLALLVAAALGANMILKKKGIDLQLHRRINRVLHGKSFKLPPKKIKTYGAEPPEAAEEEPKDDEDGEFY